MYLCTLHRTAPSTVQNLAVPAQFIPECQLWLRLTFISMEKRSRWKLHRPRQCSCHDTVPVSSKKKIKKKSSISVRTSSQPSWAEKVSSFFPLQAEVTGLQQEIKTEKVRIRFLVFFLLLFFFFLTLAQSNVYFVHILITRHTHRWMLQQKHMSGHQESEDGKETLAHPQPTVHDAPHYTRPFFVSFPVSLNFFPPPLPLPPPLCQVFPLLSSLGCLHLERRTNLGSDQCPVKLTY